MVGDPNTGMLIGQTQTFSDGVYYDQYRIGGTSLSSPLFAGLMAVADQVAGFHHGFVNPLLYSLDGTAAFNDVKPGPLTAVVRRNFVNSENADDGFSISARMFDAEIADAARHQGLRQHDRHRDAERRDVPHPVEASSVGK